MPELVPANLSSHSDQGSGFEDIRRKDQVFECLKVIHFLMI